MVLLIARGSAFVRSKRLPRHFPFELATRAGVNVLRAEAAWASQAVDLRILVLERHIEPVVRTFRNGSGSTDREGHGSEGIDAAVTSSCAVEESRDSNRTRQR